MQQRKGLSYLYFSVLLLLLHHGSCYIVDNNPNRHAATLDLNGNYQLEWLVDWTAKRVTFEVTVRTRGYIGFGLSANGKMSGADIIIGGVKPDGQIYFSDRHAIDHLIPAVDKSQDWTLHSVRENSTHTMLIFSRSFDTCDTQDDYPITANKISLIWAFGEKDDDLEYHHQNRGEYEAYLLYREYTPQIRHESYTSPPKIVGKEHSDVKVWSIRSVFELPSQDTTYWCTMHKAPKLASKHHAIGFGIRFSSEESRRHSHHLVLYKCHAPPGQDAASFFNPHIGSKGQQCLLLAQPTGPMPTNYCAELFQVWGIGGRTFFTPSHVGQPFGESPDEYYIVQYHYDNPNRLKNVLTDDTMDLYYTSKLRPNEGGYFIQRHTGPGSPPSLLLPPSSINHKTVSYCSGDCTRAMVPPEGITLVAAFPHSHNSGTKIRLQHFRNNVELPWVYLDDNYNNLFQQIRILLREVKVFPGDQLVLNCEYDNTWTNGTVVGGFSTRQEMCTSSLLHYHRLKDYNQCASDIQSEDYRYRFLGVRNVTRGGNDLEYTVVTPRRLAGLKISEVSDNHVDWTLQRRKELQLFHLHHPQVNICHRGPWNPGGENNAFITSYPFTAKPYRPERMCS